MYNISNTIDYAPLLYNASAQDIDNFYGRHPEVVRANAFGMHLAQLVIGIIATFFVGMLALSILSSIVSGDGWTGQAVLAGSVALFFAILLFGISAIERTTQQTQAKLYIRLERFATLNNMDYTPKIEQPGHTGILFLQEAKRTKQELSSLFTAGVSADVVTNVFQSKDGIQFEIGSYAAFESGGHLTLTSKSINASPYTYICIRLAKRVPHILLDNKANNVGFMKKYSNTASIFSKDQILSLEGDFNNYFTLYAPKEYEQDALYIFTPDLMTLLIDKVKDADVELIGDQLYIYKRGYMPLTQSGIAPLLELIDLIGTKVVTRTNAYTDPQTALGAQPFALKKRSFFRANIGQLTLGTLGAGLLLVALVSHLM